MRAGLTEEQRRRLGLHRPGAVMKFLTLKFLLFFFILFLMTSCAIFCVTFLWLAYFFLSVTCLPGDRLSHVTKRGMLSDPRSHSRMSSASQSEERSFASHQRKSTIGGGGSTVGGVAPREHTATEERRRNNHWEANRQPEEDESDLVSVTVFSFSFRLKLKMSVANLYF